MRTAVIAGTIAALVATRAPQPAALVTFEVVVESEAGWFVGGLTRQDFVVSTGERDLPIEDCVLDDGPVSVVVMIDLTSSAFRPGLDLGRSIEVPIVDNFLFELRPVDRVRLASFGRRVEMSGEFTSDLLAAHQALRKVLSLPEKDRSGPSPIWDALDTALSTLEFESGRRAVVLITDGKATASRKSLNEVAERATVLGIPVSVIVIAPGALALEQSPNQTAIIQSSLALERLSAVTGGKALALTPADFARKGKMLKDLDQITREDLLPSSLTVLAWGTRQAYRLTVNTGPDATSLHGVKIRTRDSSYHVRSGAGFKTRFTFASAAELQARGKR